MVILLSMWVIFVVGMMTFIFTMNARDKRALRRKQEHPAITQDDIDREAQRLYREIYSESDLELIKSAEVQAVVEYNQYHRGDPGFVPAELPVEEPDNDDEIAEYNPCQDHTGTTECDMCKGRAIHDGYDPEMVNRFHEAQHYHNQQVFRAITSGHLDTKWFNEAIDKDITDWLNSTGGTSMYVPPETKWESYTRTYDPHINPLEGPYDEIETRSDGVTIYDPTCKNCKVVNNRWDERGYVGLLVPCERHHFADPVAEYREEPFNMEDFDE